MNKQEYLNQLSEALLPYEAKIRSEIMSDYEEHFAIGYSEGKSDSEIISSLGDIDHLLDFLGEPTQAKQKPTSHMNENTVSSDSPRNVMLHGYTADIYVVPSKDNKIKADFKNHGSMREQLLYTFTGQQEGDTFVLRVDQKEKWSSFFGRLNNYSPKMEIVLEVPATLESLFIKSLSGDIEIQNVTIQNINIKTASGDTEIRNSQCQMIDVESASGDFAFRNINSSIKASTASGDIDISHHQGDMIRISTASGDTDYTGSCVRFDGNSASGDFHIRLEKDCDIKITAVSGDVHVQLPMSTEGISSLQFNSLSGELNCKHPSYQMRGSNHYFDSSRRGTSLLIRSVSGDANIS